MITVWLRLAQTSKDVIIAFTNPTVGGLVDYVAVSNKLSHLKGIRSCPKDLMSSRVSFLFILFLPVYLIESPTFSKKCCLETWSRNNHIWGRGCKEHSRQNNLLSVRSIPTFSSLPSRKEKLLRFPFSHTYYIDTQYSNTLATRTSQYQKEEKTGFPNQVNWDLPSTDYYV